MPDGNAYRPGDIWGSLDGKSVEIINTDAEGRLVLADALAYARTLAPDLIVDNATLTGACVVALGNTCSGFYATNEDDGARVRSSASKQAGEQMWRMPLLEELKRADQERRGRREAHRRPLGRVHHGRALPPRVRRRHQDWVHCDIAGPAAIDRADGWTQPRARRATACSRSSRSSSAPRMTSVLSATANGRPLERKLARAIVARDRPTSR